MNLQRLVQNLHASQWWEPQRQELLQTGFLAQVVDHHSRYNSWFQQRNPNITIQCLDDLKNIKPFTKRDIQTAGDSFVSSHIPRAHYPYSRVSTSGSTGIPVTTYKTALNKLYYDAIVMRDHQWWQRDCTGRLVSITARFNKITDIPSWGGAADIFYKTGPAKGVPVVTSLDQQIAVLEEFDPHVVIVHAGVIAGMASHWEKHGYNLNIQHLRNIGDTVHDGLRERVHAVTGLHIEDVYSSSEVGCIAIECPLSGLLHIMNENLIVEILDGDNKPCRVGEVGRVVVTDLHNSISPLIRYDLGDWAEVGPACTCGRNLPTLRRVFGRDRGLFHRADGSRYWPQGCRNVVSEIVPLRQWQIIQHDIDHLEYRMVSSETVTAEQQQEIANRVAEKLQHSGRVEVVVFENSIPLGPSGKFEETICKIQD